MNDWDDWPFTGRVVHEVVRPLGITQDGWVIGHVIRYIDVGRPDGVAPMPPRTPHEPWKRNSAATTQARMQQKITGYLRRQGIATTQQIADATGESYTLVVDHLRRGTGRLYARAGKAKGAKLWQLIEERQHEPTADHPHR